MMSHLGNEELLESAYKEGLEMGMNEESATECAYECLYNQGGLPEIDEIVNKIVEGVTL